MSVDLDGGDVGDSPNLVNPRRLQDLIRQGLTGEDLLGFDAALSDLNAQENRVQHSVGEAEL
ncbi:MAG: hypothetical protein I8H75_05830 [Myxococcaceae bacterium]|nr:hypothetical protein [Myxococcaceae bacterium]